MDFEIPYYLKDANVPTGGACVRMSIFSKGLIELGHKIGVLTWKGANEYVGKKSEIELIETYSLNEGIRIIRWLYLRIPQIFWKTKWACASGRRIVSVADPNRFGGISSRICTVADIFRAYQKTTRSPRRIPLPGAMD